MAGNIFINYRRDELGHVAGRLHDSLAPTFGRNKLFMDVDSIPVGRDFEEYLKSQVAACDAMLAVIGPNWLAAKDETGKRRLDNPDDFIVIEIGTALTRNIPVVPVLVDGAHMPKASELPDLLKLLARRQAIQVRHTNFSSDAEALVKRLREALGYDLPERRWRVRVAIGVAAVAVLLLIGVGGYAVVQLTYTTVEKTVQQREAVKAEQERQARLAAAEAEEKRKADEAERQRLAKAEQERQARLAAAEAEESARRKPSNNGWLRRSRSAKREWRQPRQKKSARRKPSDNVKKAKPPAGPATMIELWRALTRRSDLIRTTLWPIMTEASLTRTKTITTEPLPITTRRSDSIPSTLPPFPTGQHLWEKRRQRPSYCRF